MSLAERRDIFHIPPDKLEIDCNSRAFFLAGKIDEERPLHKSEIIQFLKECEQTTTPEVGDLVWIVGGDKEHLAVVETLQPVTVTDRNGLGGEIRNNFPLIDLLFEYGGLDTPMFYLQHK